LFEFEQSVRANKTPSEDNQNTLNYLINAKSNETNVDTSELNRASIEFIDELKYSNLIGRLKHKLHIELVFFMKLKDLRLNYAQQLIELEKETSKDLNERIEQDYEIHTENGAQNEQNLIENKEMNPNELFDSLLRKPNEENLNDEQFDDFSGLLLNPSSTSPRRTPPEIVVEENSSQEKLDDELYVSPSSSSFVLHRSFLSNCECDPSCAPLADANHVAKSAEKIDEIKIELETSLAQSQANKPFEIRSKSAIELRTQINEEDIHDSGEITKQSGIKTTPGNEEVSSLAYKEKPSDFKSFFSNRILRTKSKYNRSITDLSSSSSSTNTTVISFNNRFLFTFLIRSR
jgi:hypothetical protein